MDKERLKEERMELLSQNSLFDFPLMLLSVLWLILIIDLEPILKVVTCYNFYNMQYAKPERIP